MNATAVTAGELAPGQVIVALELAMHPAPTVTYLEATASVVPNVVVVWLPCGHYTTGELPWKAIDAWKIATFFRKQFR